MTQNDRYQQTMDLIEYTRKRVFSSREEWLSYLDFSARFYKYGYDDITAIYAQRPDATAVADINTWNKKVGRWIAKGAKGIAVPSYDEDIPKTSYLFDVSDTVGKEWTKPIPWTFRVEHADAIREALADNAGIDDRLLQNIIPVIAAEVCGNHIDTLKEAMSSGAVVTNEVVDNFIKAVQNSALHSVGARCGWNVNMMGADTDPWPHVEFLRNANMTLALGDAVAETNERVLRVIERTIKSYDKTKALEKIERKEQEKNGQQAGDNLQGGRGRDTLSRLTVHGSTPGNAAGQVRLPAEEVSQGSSTGNILGTEPDRQAHGESSGDRQESHGDDGAFGRGIQETEPTSENGGLHGDSPIQQPGSGLRGGNRDEGHRVRVDPAQSSFFDMIAEGQAPTSDIEEVESRTDTVAVEVGSADEPEQEVKQVKQRTVYQPTTPDTQMMMAGLSQTLDPKIKLIEDAVLRGGSFAGGSERILNIFATVQDRSERAKLVKKEYGTGGGTHTYRNPDGTEERGYIDYSSKGFILQDGHWNKVVNLKWPQVVDHIDRLIKTGQYMEPKQGALRDGVIPPCFLGYSSPAARHASKMEEYRRVMLKAGAFTEGSKERIAEATYKSYTSERDELIHAEYTKAEGTIRLDADTVGFVSYTDNEIIMRVGDNGSGPEIRQRWSSFAYDIQGLVARQEYFKDTPYIDRPFQTHEYDEAEDDEIDDDERNDEIIDGAQEAEEDEPVGDGGIQDAEITPAALVGEDKIAGEAQLPATVESPVNVAKNYRITEDSHIGEGGAKTKAHQNIEAIRLLKELEADGRIATSEEQNTLAKYVGWGGIPQAFDDDRPEWASEYKEIRELLTQPEYDAARATTLNAHYTATPVIKEIYGVLERAGLARGNLLEPGMGVGNFFGMLPEGMSDMRLTGVELDSVTGRIAKQLYPNADIRVSGFEDTQLPDNFFDAAVGNVPFGNYQLADKRYDKHHFLIHDYFFAKSLDKVRPGGVVAFITSKGTLDKANPTVRKYLAQRAEFLGAVRLPNDAFKANAGTEVTTDIIFLRKRERMMDVDENWMHVAQNADGIPLNEYYLDNPDMVLGRMAFDRSMYGNETETSCLPIEGQELSQAMRRALLNINFEIAPPAEEVLENATDTLATVPADPDVKNFTYTEAYGQIYYRENSVMVQKNLSDLDTQRMKALLELRTTMRGIIDMQLGGCTDETLKAAQATLNDQYDAFVKRHGHFDTRAIRNVFGQDSDYPLLCSLEIRNEDEYEKSDIFTKRTISPHMEVEKAETAVEALAVSLNEKGRLDLPFMARLTDLDIDTVIKDLTGLIFQNPRTYGGEAHDGWETADEYLSGNVRVKLREAQLAAERNPDFAVNVQALEDVQPVDLTASEIRVRLGATWVPANDVRDFIIETMQLPGWAQNYLSVTYMPSHAEWVLDDGRMNRGSVTATQTYGTPRMDAYKIIAATLNLKQVQVYDTNEDGSRAINRKETIAAQERQEKIKQEFENWIFKDPARRERLVRKYNEEFNSVRLREFSGAHLTFPGMTPEISLRPHQINAVARQLYGENTLLAHVVGAGKTYEIVAAAMEMKRIGIAHKPIIVVPNHLVEQWGAEFLRLYPSANVLLATKQDFEKSSRQRFVSRIATGEYDAVIIGHSSFEKIPISQERQERIIRNQIDETVDAIAELKEARGDRVSIKFLERTRKTLETNLKRLMDTSRKDDVINFEQLGVDQMFVDEAHSFKNLFMVTKMNNIAGLSRSNAMKSTDMLNKIQYLQEINNGRGVVFATGTPISNSIVEMYTMQRYLQSNELQARGLNHFDAWAANFGETVSALELTPDGNGFRVKTRFAKFFNLPELTTMFKQVADIQTADMLKLPVPEIEGGKPTVVVCQPSEELKAYIKNLGERADAVKRGAVKPTEDNMLKITHDGKMAALDMRCIDSMANDDPASKVNQAVKNVYQIWQDSTANKSTQLVFSDISTPGAGKGFSVYTDIKAKLVNMGIPDTEIAFIHEYNTDAQKETLFSDVRSGKVRILLGSTAKMGAGTNVQDKLIALHHLDVPWRPADIEQREGRIIRRGNTNPTVKIFRYVTEQSFDAYTWSLIESKQKFIGQIMTGKTVSRDAEDIDGAALSYAEVKALATGNPHVKEKMEVEMEIAKLQTLQSAFKSNIYTLQDKLHVQLPLTLRLATEQLEGMQKDLVTFDANPTVKDKDGKIDFKIEIMEHHYTDKEEAGKALTTLLANMVTTGYRTHIGTYKGFTLEAERRHFADDGCILYLVGHATRYTKMDVSPTGNIQRLDNLYNGLPDVIKETEQRIATLNEEKAQAQAELEKPFAYEEKLEALKKRQLELNDLLDIDKKPENVVVGEEEMESVDGTEEEREDEQEEEAPRRRVAQEQER